MSRNLCCSNSAFFCNEDTAGRWAEPGRTECEKDWKIARTMEENYCSTATAFWCCCLCDVLRASGQGLRAVACGTLGYLMGTCLEACSTPCRTTSSRTSDKKATPSQYQSMDDHDLPDSVDANGAPASLNNN